MLRFSTCCDIPVTLHGFSVVSLATSAVYLALRALLAGTETVLYMCSQFDINYNDHLIHFVIC